MSLHVTTNHTGKMEGMWSVSTSVFLNRNCAKNHKIPGSICSHCYSHSLSKMYKGLDSNCRENTKLLTESIIPEEELPVVDSTKFPYCRLCAFGDINNETQLQNYMNLVRKNPGSKWTLYTKMYKLVLNYFTTHEVPDNFTLMISSLFVNKRISLEPFKKLHKFGPGQLKVFTVWDKEYIMSHPELNINCGSRSCLACHACYDQRPVEEVNEILKSDQAQIGLYEALNDPIQNAKTAEAIEDFSNLILGEEDY